MKICKVCKVAKGFREFHRMKRSIGGVRTVCKDCRKLEKAEYLSRPDVIKRRQEEYQLKKVEIRERLAAHNWTINGQFHNYKKSAIKRGLTFELTEKDCIPFYKTKCFYCNDDIKALGIDRLDSSKGYIAGNMVPCCSACNFMKYTSTQEDFLARIMKIVNNLKLT